MLPPARARCRLRSRAPRRRTGTSSVGRVAPASLRSPRESIAPAHSCPPKRLAAFGFHLSPGPADVAGIALVKCDKLVADTDPSPPLRDDLRCSDEHSPDAPP